METFVKLHKENESKKRYKNIFYLCLLPQSGLKIIQRIRIYLQFEKVVKIFYYCIFQHFSTLFVIKIIITYVKKT